MLHTIAVGVFAYVFRKNVALLLTGSNQVPSLPIWNNSPLPLGHGSRYNETKVGRDEGRKRRRYDGAKVRRDEGTTGRRYDGTEVLRDGGATG